MRRFCLFVLALLVGTLLATTVGAQQYRSVPTYGSGSTVQNNAQSVRHYSFVARQGSGNRNVPGQQPANLQGTPAFQDPSPSFVQEQLVQSGRDPFNDDSRRLLPGDEAIFGQLPNRGPYDSGTFIDPVPASELSGPTYGDSYFRCRCKDEWAGFCQCYTGLSSDGPRCCGRRNGRFANGQGQGGGGCGCR